MLPEGLLWKGTRAVQFCHCWVLDFLNSVRNWTDQVPAAIRVVSCLRFGLCGDAIVTSNIVNTIQVVIFSSAGIGWMYTPCQELHRSLSIWSIGHAGLSREFQVLTLLTPRVFSYHYDLCSIKKQEKVLLGAPWSFRSPSWPFSAALPWIVSVLLCSIFMITISIVTKKHWVPFTDNICEWFDETGLTWFVEGPSFDPGFSKIGDARSAEVNWTGLASMDSWYPCPWETGKDFNLVEGNTTVSRERPLEGNAPLTWRLLLVHAVGFAFDRHLSKDEVNTRHSGSCHTLGSVSDAGGAGSRDDELIPYPDDHDDDDDDWNFVDVLVDFPLAFVLVFVETSAPFASCAVWPVVRYMTMPTWFSV